MNSENPVAKQVYDHYDFLRRLTEKRFAEATMADEAHTYAFERLAQDDWKRVRAFQGKSSFQSYIGHVWCNLLKDFAVKKFGKVAAPQWIKNLGGVWEELFRLLCLRRFSVEESAEKIMGDGMYEWDMQALEKAAGEVLAKIPDCGRKTGPAFSSDDDPAKVSANPSFHDKRSMPDRLTIDKEKWIALRALANVFFHQTADHTDEGLDEEKLGALIAAIREHIRLNEKERLILTAHFIDGESITDVGRRLGINQNQIHGQFRRLMARIRKTVPGLLEPYL